MCAQVDVTNEDMNAKTKTKKRVSSTRLAQPVPYN